MLNKKLIFLVEWERNLEVIDNIERRKQDMNEPRADERLLESWIRY